MFIVPLVFVTSWIIFTNGDADIDFDGSDNVTNRVLFSLLPLHKEELGADYA